MRTIRVFVSSPSDVRQERLCARAVLEQLKARFHGQVDIYSHLWETEYYDAPEYIQEQIERPSTFDIVILILWSTLGSAEYVEKRTGVKYASGTRYEIAETLSAPPDKRPMLLVCRCKRPFLLPADGTQEELNRLKANYDAAKVFLDRDIKACGVTSVNSFLTVADFAEILQGTLVKRIKEIIAGQRADAPTPQTTEPYKGLRVLTAEDHGFFFGRSRAVHGVVDQLRHQDAAGRPFVLIFGRSGVGKSSFARAGVIPHIVNGGVIESVKMWRTAQFEPSDSTTDLIGGLAAALCAEGAVPELAGAFTSVDRLAASLRANPRDAVHTLRSTLERLAMPTDGKGGNVRLLLLVDPMEEVFTHGAKPEEINAFAAALRALCESRLVWVLGTVRIDFYGACVEIPDLRALEDGEGHFNLPPMSLTELRDAIVEPAERAGVRFGKSPHGENLADELVSAAVAMRGEPLPLLAYSLQQLYERSNASVTGELSWAVYERLNKLPGLLDARADEARRTAESKMPGGQETAWNEVFGRLVGVDADNQRVRTYARPEVFTDPNALTLIEELDTARLIITDQDDQHRPVITIAHEAMLRQWRALSIWIDHRETLLKTTRALSTAAEMWIRHDRRDEDLTLRDTRLAAAEQFVANPQGLPVREEIAEFVRAHVRRREAEAKRKRLVVRTFLVTVTLALFIAAGLGSLAYRNYRQSETQRGIAETNRGIAKTQTKEAVAFAEFTMGEVLPRLDPRVAANKDTINLITKRAMEYFKNPGSPNESKDDALARAATISKAAHQIESLAQYAQAADLQNYALDIALQHGLSDPSELTRLHLDLADFLERSGNSSESQRHIALAGEIVRAHPDVDRLLVLDVETYRAMSLRYAGKYTEAVHAFRPVVPELEQMGPRASRVLARAYDGFTEAMRYTGRIEKSLDVYRAYVNKVETPEKQIEPRFQVEYAVLLGLSKNSTDVDNAIRRMKEAIEASQGQVEDVAQYQYKLARVLIDAGRLDEAGTYVEQSLNELRKPNRAKSKLGKCYEVRARLRLRRGEFQNALEDARQTFEIRDEKYRKNKVQREYLDACVLMTDCLESAGQKSEAATYRAKEDEIRRLLMEQEGAAATQYGEDPPSFARPEKMRYTESK